MFDRFTIIGDPHITHRSLDKGAKLFQLVEERGLPTIWMGDFLDTKEVIRGKCLNLLHEFFSKSKLEHIVLVGNHDWFNLDCVDHSLKTLSSLPNVRIIDQVAKHPKLPFVFFPYIHNKAKLREALQEYSGQDLVAFGHFEISGFDFGNGAMCEDGIITDEDFVGFKRVISGHFHKLQQRGNLTYIGTPFSHSFGEANQDKVIGTYELSTDTLALTPTDFPRHVSAKIDMSKKGAVKLLESFLDGNEDNLVRVLLFGTTEQTTSLDKTKYQSYSIKWEDRSDSPTSSGATLDETADNTVQFQQWGKTIKNLDEKTIELGLKILGGVGAK